MVRGSSLESPGWIVRVIFLVYCVDFMARYSLFVLKVPLNPKQPTIIVHKPRHQCTLMTWLCKSFSYRHFSSILPGLLCQFVIHILAILTILPLLQSFYWRYLPAHVKLMMTVILDNAGPCGLHAWKNRCLICILARCIRWYVLSL